MSGRIFATLRRADTLLDAHGSIRELAVLIGVTLLVQAIAFRFVFPGYYSPLWPHHHDFYIPVGLPYSGATLGDILGGPRPVGMLFFLLIGQFGLHGSILAVLLLVVCNCALTGSIVRRALGVRGDLPFLAAFGCYSYLIFTNPECYFIYTWDVFAQLSYFLFALAAYVLLARHSSASLALSAALVLCGFLVKETFALSLFVLALSWSLLHFGQQRRRALVVSLWPPGAFVLALVWNRAQGSPFVSSSEDPTAPYRLDLHPLSIVGEWAKYAGEFSFNALTALVLLGVCAGLFSLRGRGLVRSLALLCIFAGALAWVPNSILPNHHFAGYAWNASYLMFAPVLLTPALWRAGRVPRMLTAACGVLALASPALSVETYRRNGWYIEQEKSQRHLLAALSALTQGLPDGESQKRVLVTGIEFPFAPFDHSFSLGMFPKLGNAEVDVVAYPPRAPRGRIGAVSFVAPSEVDVGHYDRVWAFRKDGTLSANIPLPAQFMLALGGRPDAFIFPSILDADYEATADAPLTSGSKPVLGAPLFKHSLVARDKRAAHQLVEGFFSIEQDSWRWTGKRFAVVLGRPASGAGRARFRLNFSIPELAAQRYGAQAVTVTIAGVQLPTQRFSGAGAHTLVAEVAIDETTDTVRVDVALEKSFVPGNGDERELGVIVSAISLESA